MNNDTFYSAQFEIENNNFSLWLAYIRIFFVGYVGKNCLIQTISHLYLSDIPGRLTMENKFKWNA